MNIRKFGQVNGLTNQPIGLDVGAGINTGDATATALDIALNKTAYGSLGKITGTGSNIKSIQRTIITQSGAGGSQTTATISAVNLANTIVRAKFKGTDTTTDTNNQSRVELTNATTVTCFKGASSTPIDIFIEVIEFNNVKSIQSGLATQQPSNDLAVTISAVNMSKTLIFATGTGTLSATGPSYNSILAYYLTSSTSFTIVRGSFSFNVQWYVIEFN